MTTITVGTDLTTINCGECGGTYAINERYRQKKQEAGGFWHCPYCQCSWGYSKDATEIARLKRNLEYKEAEAERERKLRLQERESHQHTQRRLSATQGVVTRTKNRVSKGVCPCCNRTFADLQRHMASKHPTYTTDADE